MMVDRTRLTLCLIVTTAVLGGQATARAGQAETAPGDPATRMAEAPKTTEAPLSLNQPSYLISSQRITGDHELLWPGFLHGMRDFDGFANPNGNPLYFESPFINTELRFIYMWHKFTKSSGDGDLSVFAAQARLALTDRLALIATKDGYTNLGSTDVAGNSVFCATIGWEWKFTPNLSWSVGYEFPLHTTDTDIFDQRVTTHIALKF